MADYLKKLLSLSSPSLCGSRPSSPKAFDKVHEKLAAELVEILRVKNGFYAFESALHVLPSHCVTDAMDIERWNSRELWKGEYSEEVAKYLFFAEDIFGEQFGLCADSVVRFDPETAGTEVFADSPTDWAERILRDYEVETGYPIAAEYQEKKGPLIPGQRLEPKIPFILGEDTTLTISMRWMPLRQCGSGLTSGDKSRTCPQGQQ